MKYLLYFFLIISSLVSMGQDLVILHTNDMHSHLNGFSPEAEYTPLVKDDDPTFGGFSRIAGYIKTEKAIYNDRLMVLDAGDFLMGTLFQTLELGEGFELNLMKEMGYDFVAIGNHEFDFGPDSLAMIIQKSKKNGPIPQLLFANYKRAKVDDRQLRNLFNDGTILPYSVVEKNGYRIGLFGLLGIDAEESILTKYGVEVLKPKKIAQQTALYLKKKEKVDLVIALSHSGVQKNKKEEWDGEDVAIGEAAPDVDIIISGHTHSVLNEAVKAGNAIVVQTGSLGVNVGRLEVSFGPDRKPIVQYKLVPMNDDIVADGHIQSLIDAKEPEIEKNILKPIGVGFNDIVAETSFDLVMDELNPNASNLGPFLADAIYQRVNSENGPGTDVVFVASGVIRTNISKGNEGKQNINDAFNLMSLGMGNDNVPGYALSKIYVTGNELKKVMELILAVYNIKTTYYLFFAGMQVDYNPHKGLFKKVTELRIGNDVDGYQKIATDKRSDQLIGITANSYMIGFISRLKKMSFGIVNVVPKRADGSPIEHNDFIIDIDPQKEGVQEAKEWISIYQYLKQFDDLNGNGIPDIPEIYKSKVNALTVVQ